MSDQNDLEDARRSLGQNLATALQVGAQLFTAYVQLRLLALRRAEAQAAEAAEQTANAAAAVAAQARAAYARDREAFTRLSDPQWWAQATPADVKDACARAMQWAPASPEAAAAARTAAAFIDEYDLGAELDVDVEALARARVDPAHAREFAAMQTGAAHTGTRSAETDPNAKVVREAFGDRADEFLWCPMWDTLSEAIDHAHQDGQYDVVSLLQEGDRWRDYHDPDNPDTGRRDMAGLLAWRVENYLGSTDRYPGATWKGMNPRPRSASVIDGEVIDGEVIDREDEAAESAARREPGGPSEPEAAEPVPPPVNPDHQAMAAQLAEEWPDGAERLTGSRHWSRAAERLCRLRDVGVDVVPYLLGLKIDWDRIRDPAAYLSKIIDNDPPTASPPAAETPRNQEGAPHEAPLTATETAMAAYAAANWPAEAAQQVLAAPNWPVIARLMERLYRDETEAVVTIGHPGADGKLDPASLADPQAPYVVVIDPDRSDQAPRLSANPITATGKMSQRTRPAPAAATSPQIEERHRRIVEVMRQKWPDSVEAIVTSRRWTHIEQVFDDLAQNGTDIVAVIEHVPVTLADKDFPAAYFEKILVHAHQEHQRWGPRRAPAPTRPARIPRPGRVWHVDTGGKAAPAAFRSLMAAVGPMKDGKRVIALPAAPIRPVNAPDVPTSGMER